MAPERQDSRALCGNGAGEPGAGWQLWILPLALLPMLASAWARGLWAPDEPRYAEVAREMWETRDFLVPHLCGEVYPDKPPLVFWLSGWFGSMTGWNELAMRLPSVLALLGTAYFTRRFALAWWTAREATWAPCIFLSTALATWLGGRLQMDPVLTFFCVAALFLATSGGLGGRVGVLQLLGAGLCLGCGALAKGPVAWVDTGLPILIWIALRRRRSAGRGSFHAPPWASLGAVVVAIVPVVVWALMAISREPQLRDHLLFGEHLARIVQARSHPGPPWEPVVEMSLFLMPWSLPLIAMGVASFRRGAARDEGCQLAWYWLVGLLVFFSLISEKRELYLLPAYPAAGLIAARWLVLSDGGGRAWPWITVPTAAVLATLGLAACSSFLLAGRVSTLLPHASGLAWRGFAIGLPTTFLGWRAVRAAIQRRPTAWAGYLLATWVVVTTLAGILVLPLIDPYKSPSRLGKRLAARDEQPLAIPCLGVRPEGYRFYSGRPVVEGRLEEAFAAEGSSFLALVEKGDLPGLPDRIRAATVVLEEVRVGSRIVCLVGRKPR